MKTLWHGRPSQWTNLGVFLLCALTCFLIIPIFYAIWKYLIVKNETYDISEQTITLHTGVLNKQVDDVQLYRIKDIRLERPLLLRLFGLGNIHMITSDQTNPYISLRAIGDSEALRLQLRQLVEEARNKRGVREFDTFGEGSIE